MADEAFNLVFRGEVLEGQMAPDVKLRLGRLLKVDHAQVATMFAGEPVVLKREVDRATAAQYQAAFRKVGARLRVLPASGQPSEGGHPSETGQPSDSGQPSESGHPSKSGHPSRTGQPSALDQSDAPVAAAAADVVRKPSLAERLAAENAVPPQVDDRAPQGTVGTAASQVTAPVPELVLAPAGADVLRPDERPAVAPVNVDTSGLSVAEAGAGLADPVPQQIMEVDISHLSLADLGVELGHSVDVHPVEIDVSGLSLAEAGEFLANPREHRQVDVDTSGLSLAEPGAELGEPRAEPD